MILLILTALLTFVFLELNHNTLLGWLCALLLFSAYGYLYQHLLKSKGFLLKLGSWVLLLLAVILIVNFTMAPFKPVKAVEHKDPQYTDIITIRQGQLKGVYSADQAIEIYTGIPYAQPPVGQLRWKEPQDPASWEGVKICDEFAPMSMQPRNPEFINSLVSIIGYHDYTISLKDNFRQLNSEDSLYLNIWKPAGKVADLPVLVFIHGGSLQTGQPWYKDYSGEGLAKEGVIVVNMGYRLGTFGFYADPQLAEESPNHTTGNYGLLDQIKALQWVQDNIAAFGGNPDNVTVAGESAGSACVAALLTSPLAKGLFNRAILESSTLNAVRPAHSYRTLESGYETSRKTRQQLGVSTLDELRALPAEKLVDLADVDHHLTVDGYALTESPYESFSKGICNAEAILHGFNASESYFFTMFNPGSLKNYGDKLSRAFGDKADEVMKLYPASTNDQAKANWYDINTSILFSYGHYCLSRQAIAQGIPVYEYYFTKENKRLGNNHGGEMMYFFGNIPAKSKLFDDTDRQLEKIMMTYFRNFITCGDPNGTDLPRWDKQTDADQIFELGDQIGYRPEPFVKLNAIIDQLQGFESGE